MRTALSAVRLAPAALLALLACSPATTRPGLTPFPESAGVELHLEVPMATERVAAALRADSIPLRRVHPRDGWIETVWLDAATRRPTRRRPFGPDVVRLRVWVNPGRVHYSQVVAEVVYRPLVDPSLPERELERVVAPDHPLAAAVRDALDKLRTRYGR